MESETDMNPRDRILQAAARLLAEGGREAVSTRAVSSAAGVQAPTIYRQFGDMQGACSTRSLAMASRPTSQASASARPAKTP